MGAGIDMAPGDIAFKCNFATLDTATKTVIKRRADRHFEDVGPELCAVLDGAHLHATHEFFLLCSKYHKRVDLERIEWMPASNTLLFSIESP